MNKEKLKMGIIALILAVGSIVGGYFGGKTEEALDSTLGKQMLNAGAEMAAEKIVEAVADEDDKEDEK